MADDDTSSRERRRKAGAFDIRNIIAMLGGIYGVVLLLTGLLSSEGRAINLYSGAGIAATAAAFVIWARLRPTIVEPEPGPDRG